MNRSQSMVGLILLASIGFPKSAIAQVVRDNTVGTSVNTAGNIFTITGGTRSGNNLFHSFSQFSVPTNGSAIFNNATDVQNIFSRVTGSSASSIDGLIKANGNASLFLMNPNGIVFGPNATLNIGGSFIGTTANSIKFQDGIEFSAGNLTTTPLLSVKVPIGLQFGPSSGSTGGITVQGGGHQLTSDLFHPMMNRSQNPIGLQVNAGNTLALIGRDVNLSAGIVGVQGGGHLEIGSVRNGHVQLNATAQGWAADYSAVQQFRDIHLAQQSLLDASGSTSSIQLQGHNINLTEGSAALIQNLGVKASGGITVNATGSINLTGNTPNGKLGSVLRIDNLGGSQGGDITISAAQLSLRNGAEIHNQTFSSGNSGNISIRVTEAIEIDSFAPGNPNDVSVIATDTTSFAKAGDVTISTGSLRILNSGNLSSATVAFGQAGTVRVNAADSIEIAGNNPFTFVPSTLSSSTLGMGNSGDTFVNTSRLILHDGGSIGSATLAIGSAGNVTVNASESVEIKGKGVGFGLPSRIASNAEILDPITQAALGLPPIPSGNAGYLTINTPSLRITDGAYVSVKNDGPGSAGDVEINSKSLFLDHQGSITASTVSGNGGDIRLNSQDLVLMRHNSRISSTATGTTGDGGNVFINTASLVGIENSDIIANSKNGKGGNIEITLQSIFGLQYRDRTTPENDITASSEFGINGDVQVNTIGINPTNALNALPTDISDSTRQLSDRCASSRTGSFVSTGRGGMPQTPIQRIKTNRTWHDLRPMIVTTSTPIQPITSVPPMTQLVEASAIQVDETGAIALVAPQSIPSNPATCATSMRS
jgi:filamentous hemagglutinin family protein